LKIHRKILFGSAACGALALGAALLWVWADPPPLLRVAANYSAKIVCSNVFLAGRDPDEVLRDDIQSSGNPVLRFMHTSVNREAGLVRAGLFGPIGRGLAVYRPGAGCAALPDGKIPAAAVAAPASAASAANPASNQALESQPWPGGSSVATEAALDRLIGDERLAGPGMRAIVVVHRGKIVAERYAPGFSAKTPLLGWSMTKTVTAGLIGMLVQDGRLRLEQSAGWPAAPGDGRERITVANLLAMSSGLHFDESYGVVSDVTRMLYLEPDMAAFVRSQPLEHPPGTVWSYSSGTAVVLARLFQDTAGAGALDFVHERLFVALGMHSATLETDAHGTLVGSSYMYASARDWARFGQFLVQQGVWQGVQLLPPGYVKMMATPVAASGGQYGQGLVWLWGSDPKTPGENPDARFGLPSDTFWMEGHDGQTVAIIPSQELVIVRLGLTPSSLGYRPQPLVQALLGALG
jgi:CubicO group peptidase (beta-lactamase class C family)